MINIDQLRKTLKGLKAYTALLEVQIDKHEAIYNQDYVKASACRNRELEILKDFPINLKYDTNEPG